MRVRKLSIQNFRGISHLEWQPSDGINCLVGPGDSGKSTIIDALDWCLGARRTLPVSDADFFALDVDDPIVVECVLGDLDDGLKNLDAYGAFLRGLTDEGDLEDEPGNGLETVLVLRLQIENDLAGQWQLVSPRAEDLGQARGLSWSDRVSVAPTRIGTFANQHLGWQRGSILNLLANERADASAQLAEAGRQARKSFGDSAGEQLAETLGIVDEAADELGVGVGEEARAMLDAHSLNFSGGTIALHDGNGVPLRKLGMGSSRLLIAGLQRRIAERSSIALVDEVEIGLEPHRISKFLTALGSKQAEPPMQVFMSTHSPVVLRELKSPQLGLVRAGQNHSVMPAGHTDDVQATLRSAPEGFLGLHVLICEGATEVGLLRGLDLYLSDCNRPTFQAAGGVVVDGGGVSRVYRKALPFSELLYHAAVLRDDDVQPDAADEQRFEDRAGTVFKWTVGWAFEEELFDCLSDDGIENMWEFLIGVRREEKLVEHLRNVKNGSVDIDTLLSDPDDDDRALLAKAAKKGSWLKRIDIMEEAAHRVVGPDLVNMKDDFTDVIGSVYEWAGVDYD
ncbi:ATP-dependent nuclease [Salipiger mucosus]|uniref:ATPase AAA-type core domain-containing protein n=1 Tax=Salipiger mucosus DSM 16094 TaxID=1123237 RepID=S9Q8R1_9RHOB|nr:ATP-binding protein [Salipiger mucosus]EPX76407.1 hypothetical protein Salmuc_02909 [Salipiger mucosus DSM 16094]